MKGAVRVKSGEKIFLKEIDAERDKSILKEELLTKTEENIEQLLLWQQKLYAEGKQSLLIVLQAMDAGGKDGVIRKVLGRINPQGCRVTSFKAPSKLELTHDFLWRVHREVPAKGMIGVFNRSHYEDVLITAVHGWINKKEVKQRYAAINAFEKLLEQSGTHILKFYLHISKEEQKQRFQERLDIPEKNWKFNSDDLKERAFWDDYQKQFEYVFEHTSKSETPWYVIPADSKKYRNYLISSIILDELKKMNPKFPLPEEGLTDIEIKD